MLVVLTTSCLSFALVDINEEGSENDVIYIKPTSSLMSVHCPLEPCHTLSYFAEKNTLENKSATTLFFLPGNHNLNLEIEVANITEMIMTANSSFVEISCQNMSYFKFYKIRSLLITGLNFHGCANNKIMSVNQCIVQNSFFLGQVDIPGGTALDIFQANAYIINCSFINNKFGSYRGPIKIEDVSV